MKNADNMMADLEKQMRFHKDKLAALEKLSGHVAQFYGVASAKRVVRQHEGPKRPTGHLIILTAKALEEEGGRADSLRLQQKVVLDRNDDYGLTRKQYGMFLSGAKNKAKHLAVFADGKLGLTEEGRLALEKAKRLMAKKGIE